MLSGLRHRTISCSNNKNGTVHLTLTGPVDMSTSYRTLTVNNSTTILGAMTDYAGFYKYGTGNLVLGGSNTFTGWTYIYAGQVIAANPWALQYSVVSLNNSNGMGGMLTFSNITSATVGALVGSGGLTLTNVAGNAVALTIGGNNNGATFYGSLQDGGKGASVTKVGSGTVWLYGSNTYSGGTTISAGTLAIGGYSNLLAGRALNISGGTLQVTGTQVTNLNAYSVNWANFNGGLDVNSSANTLTVTNSIGGTGSLTKQGLGTLRLAGANTFSGGLTNNAGTLALGADNVVGTGRLVLNGGMLASDGASTRLLTNTISLLSSSYLNIQFGAISGTGNLMLSGTMDLGTYGRMLTVSNTTTISGVISNSAGFAKAGNGTLILSGANTFSGGVTNSAGTLALGANNVVGTGQLVLNGGTLSSDGALARSVSNNIMLAANSQLGSATGTGNLTLSGMFDLGTTSRTLTVSNNTTITGVMTDSAGFTKAGSGTLTLAGSNTFTGAATVSAGRLVVNGSLSTGASVSVVSGAILSGQGVVGGTVTVGNGGVLEAGQNGVGTLRLGNLVFSNSAAINIGDATLYGATAGLSIANNVTVNGGSNSVTVTVGAISGAGTYHLMYFGGSLLGTGLSGFSLATLPNNTTGFLTLNGGHYLDLKIGNASYIRWQGGSSIWSTSAGSNWVSGTDGSGTYYSDSPSDTVVFDDSLTGTNLVNISVADVHPTAVTFNNGNVNYTLQGTYGMAGAASLTKNGGGVLKLAMPNSYSGGTRDNAGMLVVGANNAMGSGLLLMNGGALSNAAGGSFSLSNTISLASSASVGVGLNDVFTLRGSITNAGGLTKLGGGTLMLTGTNSYSGGTSNNAGTLSIGSDTALGTGTLVLNGGALASADATPHGLANNILLASNTVFGQTSGGTGALNLSGTVDVGTAYRSLTVNNSTTLSGALTNTAGFYKYGNGKLVLSGSNNFSGWSYIYAGQLVAANPWALQNSVACIYSPGSLTFSNITALTVGGLSGSAGLALTNDAGNAVTLTENVSSNNNVYFYGNISDGGQGGALVKAGQGTAYLYGSNTFTGGVTINAGTLAVGGYSNMAAGSALNIAGGTLRLIGTQVTNLSPYAVNWNTFNGGLDVNSSGASLLVSNVIGGVGALTKLGAGTLSLSGANTYSGGTSNAAGMLAVGADNALGTGQLVLVGGALASTDATAHMLNNNVLLAASTQFGQTNGGGALTLSGTVDMGTVYRTLTVNNSTTLAGQLTNSAGFYKYGTGNLVLAGSNTFTGYTYIYAGQVVVANPWALQNNMIYISNSNSVGGQLTFSNITAATLGGLSGSGNLVLTNAAGSAVALTIGNNNNGSTYYGSHQDGGMGGSLTKVGLATEWLYGSNTFTGGLTINAGTVAMGGYSNLVAGSALNISGGALQITGTQITNLNTYAVNWNSFNGKLDVNHSNNTLVVSDAIGSTGSLTKQGVGTLLLSAANSYSGGTTNWSGVLALGGDNVLGTGKVVLYGGTLASDGVAARALTNAITLAYNAQFGSGVGSGDLLLSGTMDMGTYVRTLTASNSTIISGAMTNSAGFVKMGNGTLTLSGANTFSGTSVLNAGTLALGGANVLGSSVVTLGGATLASDGATARTLTNFITLGADSQFGSATGTGNLTLTGTINNGTTNRTLTVLNTTTFSGALTNMAGITKAGAGTLVLAGSNTYTGATVLNTGQLYVNGSLASSSAVSVAAGATLGGQGAIGGVVAVADGGKLEAGQNGSGTLTLGNLVFSNSAVLSIGDASSYGMLAGLSVANNVTLYGGTNSIAVNIASVTGAGTYHLMYFGGSLLGVGLQAFALTPIPDYSNAYLTLNGGHYLDLQINGASFLRWSGGGDGQWNVASAGNWASNTNAVGSYYSDSPGDSVSFDDSVAGSTIVSVSAADVHPGAVTFNNSLKNYTLQGSYGIAGTASISKNGNGVVTIAMANSYSGGTMNNAGLLVVGANNALGSGLLTMNGGALSNAAGGSYTLNNTLNLASAANVGVGAGDVFTLGGALTNGGALVKLGNGTLLLSGANSYSGGTSNNAGMLALGADNVLGSGQVVLNGGGLASADASAHILTNNMLLMADAVFGQTNGGTGALTLAGTLDLGAVSRSLTVNSATLLSGALTNTAGFFKNGAGSLILSGVNTYTGATYINAGQLVVANTLALQNTTVTFSNLVGALTFSNVTTASIGGLAGNGNLALTNGAGSAVALVLGGNNSDSSFSGSLRAAGSLSKAGSGALYLYGSNTYSGGTFINAGTLVIGGYSNLAAGSALNLNGGALRITGTQITNLNAYSVNWNSLNGGLDISASNNTLTVSNLISGSSAVTKLGSGTLLLSGANTYTGGTVLAAGTLRMGSDLALGSGVVTLTNGTLASANAAGHTFSNQLVLGNSVQFGDNVGTGALTNRGAVNLGAGWPTLTVSNTTVLAGLVSGSGGFFKQGNGTLVLTGSNTFSGGIIASNVVGNATNALGVLRLGNNNGFGTGALTLGGITLASDSGTGRAFSNAINIVGTVQLGDFSGYGALTNSGAINLGGANRVLVVSNTTVLRGVISNGGLLKQGSGTLVLSGANTYAGGTSNSTGILRMGADNVFGTGPVSLGGGTLASDSSQGRTFTNALNLSYSSGSIYFGDATGSGNITNSGTVNLSGYPTLYVNTGTVVLAGTVSGSSGFNKYGNGALTLAGVSTYSGSSYLYAGALRLGNDRGFGVSSLGLYGGVLASDGAASRSFSNAISLYGNVQFGDAMGTGNLTNNGSVYVSGMRTLTVSNITLALAGSSGIYGSGGIVKAGNGTLVLGGSNTYSGGTLVSTGTLQVGMGGTRGSLGSGGVTNNSTLIFNRSDSLNLSNNLAGTGTFIQSGSGTLNLLATNGASSFTGPFLVNSGVLAVGEDSQLGANTNRLTLDGGTLRLSANIGSLSVNNAGSGFTNAPTVAISGGTNGVGVAASALALSHLASVRLLSSGNNYTSAPMVTFSTPQLSNGVQARGYALVSGGQVTGIVITNAGSGYTSAATVSLSGGGGSNLVYASATVNGYALDSLQLMGVGIGYTAAPTVTLTGGGSNVSITANMTVASLAASRNITLNAGGGTFDVDTGFVPSINGVIGGVGALTKIGSGTLQLKGVNTYAGDTTVKAGTLMLAGANGALTGTSGVFLRGGTLALFNSATANNSSRLGDALALTSYGGGLTFSNDGSSAAFSESLGSLSLNVGNLDLQTTPGVGGQNATLTIGTLNRAAGSTLRIFANQLGGSTNSIVFSAAPALDGGILPGAIVVHDGLVDLVTLDGATGHALVPFTGYASGSETTWNGNTVFARPTASQTLTDNRTVHSLVLDNDINLNVPTANRVLTLGNGGVGMIVQTGGASQILPGSDVQNVLAFGNNEAVFDVEGRLTFATRNAGNAISGAGGLTKSGLGTLQLGSATASDFRQTTTGNLSLNQGLLDIYATSSAGLSSFSNVVFNGGSLSLHTTGAQWYANTLLVNADASLTNYSLNGAGTTLAFSNLTIGAQTLTLAANGQLTGGSTISFDTVTLTGNSTFYISTNNTCGNTLALGAIDHGAQGYTFTKSGPGALALIAAGSHQGATTANDGLMILAAANCLDTNSTLTVDSGATVLISSGDQTIGGLNGGGTVSNAAGSTLSLGNDGSDAAFGGTITGTGSVNKVGGGTQTLTSQNTYSGTTTISDGTLQLGTGNALPTNTDVSVTGGTLYLGGQTQTVATLHNDGGSFSTGNGGVLQGTGSTIEWGGNSLNTINTNGVVMDAHVVVTSAGANTIEAGGSLVVSAGGLGLFMTNSTLTINSDADTPGRLALSSDLTAAQNSAIVSGGSEVLAGQLDLGGDTRQFNVLTNSSLLVSAVLTNGSLNKVGAGKLELTGDNSANPVQAQVNEGKLAINGSYGGLVTVYSGGTLGGTGSLGGVVISGGVYSPGNSPGTQSVSSVSFNGGIFSVELVNAAHDLVSVTNSVNGVVLSDGDSQTFLSLSLTNFDATLYSPFVIVDNQSSQRGDTSGHFWWHTADGDLEMVNYFDFIVQDAGNGSNYFMRINYDGGDGNDITLMAIPEPDSVLVLLVACGSMALWRRWKRRWQNSNRAHTGRQL